ncbi:VC1465 family Xer recombination activation factor [Pseudomethylobacillus aquaticus]|uniref:VC1465 family Xer recombination activation factor n=1 Tax=Pseudomethylobacillus aquaticus TaxID=2676064 RepID=UPI00138FA444|nr:VC1465 family Xer recombination activation factor [Pseudomethylobacillus aquaticus]
MVKRRYKRKPYKPIDYERFRQTRLLAGLTQTEAACLLHVTERTVRLWEQGRHPVPYAAFKLLRILTGYALPGDAWAGWQLHGEHLTSPGGRTFTAKELGWMWLTFAMARNWQEQRLAEQAARSQAREAAALSPPSTLRLVK